MRCPAPSRRPSRRNSPRPGCKASAGPPRPPGFSLPLPSCAKASASLCPRRRRRRRVHPLELFGRAAGDGRVPHAHGHPPRSADRAARASGALDGPGSRFGAQPVQLLPRSRALVHSSGRRGPREHAAGRGHRPGAGTARCVAGRVAAASRGEGAATIHIGSSGETQDQSSRALWALK